VAVIDIRVADATDAAELAELRWEFRVGREPASEPHDAFVARCEAWMRHELSGAVWRSWVAIHDGVIVGAVWLRTLPKIPNPVAERDHLAYLSNLYVRPSERGGTGTALLEMAIRWARAQEMDRVILWPTGQSVTLYARHGFTRAGDVMELALGKPHA
jgi:GNAT superfamily N-acetyltransferase